MWCDDAFADHNERLLLDATRRGRIESAVDALANFVRTDDELRIAMDGSPFLQGSVASRTSVRPIEDDEFDVDVVYPFDLDMLEPKGPESVLNWFEDRLRENAFYRDNMLRKHRCVRIDYAEDFHMDVIPATESLADKNPYAVPTRDLRDWLQTDPNGFRYWVVARDRESGNADASGDGSFVRAVRYLKRWRDHHFSEESGPSSILLLTVLGKHEASKSLRYRPPLEEPLYLSHKRDAAYVYDLLRITLSCLADPPPGAFNHPTNIDEDLAGQWVNEHLDGFLERMQLTIVHMQQAIWADSRKESIEHYRRALGPSFPAT